jgi:hypothetical protein
MKHGNTNHLQMQLTPGQSTFIHGWFTPKPSLRWNDVVESPGITFARCKQANVSLRQLYQLQPDVSEWIRFGGVTLDNVAEMHETWDIDVFRDFKADLADVLRFRWGSEVLRRIHVTYERLIENGMTAETMRMFGFTLLGWINLGFKQAHIQGFTDLQIISVFGMTRQVAESCFITGSSR